MKTYLTIAIIVAAMALSAYFITKLVIVPKLKPQASAAVEEKHEEKAEGEHGEGHNEVYLVENLLVNPTGTNGTRFLSATLGLEVAKPETAKTLEDKKIQVRDLLIAILSARTVEQLTDTAERDNMRGEIKERLNELIGGEELAAVYFVDYVLQ